MVLNIEKNYMNSQIKSIALFSSIIALIVLISIALILTSKPVPEPLSVEPQIIKATLKDGEKIEQTFTITNLLKKDIIAYLEIRGINGKIAEQINLKKYGKENVTLLASLPEKSYGTFVGKVEFLTEKHGKSSALIILDSETRIIDFDATIEPITPQSQNMPGSLATFLINLYNIRNSSSRDLLMEYSLITTSGSTIMTESEKLTAEEGEWTKAGISKSIRIPTNAAPGRYILSLKLTSKDSVAVSSTFFEVDKALDPAFVPLCPTKGISCSLVLVVLALIAFFIGGYAYYSLASAILSKVKEKESNKKKNEMAILTLLIIITLFLLYQLITKVGIIQRAIGSSSGLLKIIVILIIAIAALKIAYKNKLSIASRIKKTISIVRSKIKSTKPKTQAINEKKQLPPNKALGKIKQYREFNMKQFRKLLEYSKALDRKMLAKLRKKFPEKEYHLNKKERMVIKPKSSFLANIWLKRLPSQENAQIEDAEKSQNKLLKELEQKKYSDNPEQAEKEIKKLALEAIKKIAKNSKGRQKKRLLKMQDAKYGPFKHKQGF